jgi:hypothetical protein
MTAVAAAIKFTQGATTDLPGIAVIGITGASVVVSNGNNANVGTWAFEIFDVPPTSAVAPVSPPPPAVPVFAQQGPTPTFAFTPDRTGGYCIHLRVVSVDGTAQADDFRVFQVAEASGRIIPPYRATDQMLNFRIGGVINLRGWAPFQEAYDRFVDTLAGGGSGIDTVLSPGNANQAAFSGTVNTLVLFSGLTASRTCTMPAAPTTGAKVCVCIDDASGLSFGVSVVGNGHTIGSALASTYAIVGGGVAVTFEYDGGTWRIVRISYPTTPPVDAADQIRWSFSEAARNVGGGFANSGAGGALVLSTHAGRGGDTTGDAAVSPTGVGYSHGILGQPNILFAPDPGGVSAWPANPLSTTVGESAAAFTMHGWVNPRSYPAGGGGTQVLCYKIYSSTAWVAPFIAAGLVMIEPPAGGAAAGDWQGYITNVGVLNSGQVLASVTGSVFTIPLNQWTHLALTFTSGAGARLYFNGQFTGVTIASGGQPIDFGTHGPWEMLGETTSDAQFLDGSVAEWRTANVARSDAYLKNYVLQAQRALPLVA